MGAEPDLLWMKAERSRRFRFGIFELDPRGGELWKAGVRTRLQPQPARVLSLLVSRSGELVTREEIQREVWPEGTFVDFEQSLNFCIRQIRTALGDQAATPRYVETLPRRGYRLLVPVEIVGGAETVAAPASERGPASVQGFPAVALAPSRARRLRRPALVAAAALGGVLVGMAAVKLVLPRAAVALPRGRAGPHRVPARPRPGHGPAPVHGAHLAGRTTSGRHRTSRCRRRSRAGGALRSPGAASGAVRGLGQPQRPGLVAGRPRGVVPGHARRGRLCAARRGSRGARAHAGGVPRTAGA